MTENKRNINLDIIRVFAFLGVVGIHFFLNSGFYNIPIKNYKHLIIIIVRTFFLYCVPLFIMLTGFLLNHKTVSLKYYKGILKTLLVYVIVSIVLIIYNNIQNGAGYSVSDSFFMMLSFSGAKYSWYVEMYIGLFMIIPYLNLIYNNLQTKEQKMGLILVGLLLTSFPLFFNSHNYRNLNWWTMPSQSNKYQQILPKFWVGVYPVVYYYIGCFIEEYRPKINTLKNFIYIVITTVVFGIYNFYRSFGSAYIMGKFQGWESPFTVLLSILIFIYILNLNTSKLSNKTRKLLVVSSNATLGAYLISSMFDDYFYSILNAKTSNYNIKSLMIFVIVPVVSICSLLFSITLNFILDFVKKKYKLKKTSKNIKEKA